MKLLRTPERTGGTRDGAHVGRARVHTTPCYDFLVSLRALFNPRTYDGTRAWASATRASLSPGLLERGAFFFQHHDTSLGSGAIRLVAGLREGAEPAALIRKVRAADPRTLALLLLDTGETAPGTLATFERAMVGAVSTAELGCAFAGESADWSRRCRRVLADPEQAQADLVLVLEEYLATVFAAEVRHVVAATAAGAERANELLGVLPTVTAIEQLTGGYTLSAELQLQRITLAPSAFIYPFMASRVDERAGEALIVFGVKSDTLLKFDRFPIDPDLVRAVKALGDPGRLKVLRLLGQGPTSGADLVALLGLSAPTVHHHLHQLRAAGLVRQERTKGGMQYTIRPDSARALLDALGRTVLGDQIQASVTPRPTATTRATRSRGG